MFDSEFDRDSRPLVGISVSAVSLLALACIAGCCLAIFGFVYMGALMGGDLNRVGRAIATGFAVVIGFALCIVTFWAWKALYRQRPWALWIARTWAVLLIIGGAMDLCYVYLPHTPAPDEYFSLVFDPVLIFGGAAWLLYLSLPKVRQRFRSHTETV